MSSAPDNSDAGPVGPEPPAGMKPGKGHNRNLGKRAARGVGWKVMSTGGKISIHILSTVILSRLLTPEDFGRYAMALLVVEPVQVLASMGITAAVVQTPLLYWPVVTRLAFTGVMAGALLGGLCALGAWLMLPTATGVVVAAMASLILIQAYSMISQGLIKRELEFNLLLKVELSAELLFLLFATGLAWIGLGVWSMVLGTLLSYTIRSLWLARARTWPKGEMAPLRDAMPMLRFGWWGCGSHVLASLARIGDGLIVERLLGLAPLGLYNRACRLAKTPSEIIISTVGSVFFPLFAKVQNDLPRLRQGFLISCTVFQLTTIPMAAMVVVLAPEIVNVALGSQWGEAVLPLQALGLFLLCNPLAKLADDLLRGQGQGRRPTVVYACYLVAVPVLCIPAAKHGLAWVALGAGLANLLRLLLMVRYCLRTLDTTWGAFLLTWLPGGLIAGVASLATWLVLLSARAQGWHQAISLGLGLAIFGVVFLLGVAALPGTAMNRLRDLIRDQAQPLWRKLRRQR